MILYVRYMRCERDLTSVLMTPDSSSFSTSTFLVFIVGAIFVSRPAVGRFVFVCWLVSGSVWWSQLSSIFKQITHGLNIKWPPIERKNWTSDWKKNAQHVIWVRYVKYFEYSKIFKYWTQDLLFITFILFKLDWQLWHIKSNLNGGQPSKLFWSEASKQFKTGSKL